MNKVIALPVQVASVTVHVAKGRRWSVVEHLLLDAVAREPRTADKLASLARLPPRMVIEALINLMRAGWVELQSEKDHLFAATAGGRAVVDHDDLPASMRLMRRPVRYAVDRLSGAVLRYRELDFVWASRFRTIKDQVDAVIEPVQDLPEAPQIDVIGSLLDEDEEYRGVVPSSARVGDGYALVQVINGAVQNLRSAPFPLLKAILAVVPQASGNRKEVRAPAIARPDPTLKPRSISINPEDIIFGGDEHEALLHGLISNAQAFVTIHSTFVGGGNSDVALDLIEQAARERGVKVDILWGKSDKKNEANETREACVAINERMKKSGLNQFVRAHPFPTDSHSKIIIADDGKGGVIGALGSCNWLSTGFTSFELSFRSTDPLLVSDMMEVCAQMARVAVGLNGGIAAALAGQAINIRKRTVERTGRKGLAQIVLAPQHADFLRRARDEADHHILVGSHRFGRSADDLTLTPTQAAIDAKENVQALVYYGRLSDGLTPVQAAGLKIMHGRSGLSIRQVFDPRMHAKFLLWDDDDIVITSHNLLSANPSQPYAEIGLYLHAGGMGRVLREKILGLFPPDTIALPTDQRRA